MKKYAGTTFRALTAIAMTLAGCAGGAGENDVDEGATSVSIESIIGGTPATAYPEAAYLNIDTGSGPWYACSGTLIAPRVVLTAGHCVDRHKKWEVYVNNEYRLSTSAATYDWKNAQDVVNPAQHDLGLVFLDTAVTLATYPTIAQTGVVAGSKAINIGRILNGKLTSSLYQAPVVLSSAVSIGYPYDYVSSLVIQAGDSGGPVMLNGTHKIVAVNSGAGGSIQVLARVDLLYAWIAGQIASHPVSMPAPAPSVPKPNVSPSEGTNSVCVQESEPNDSERVPDAMVDSQCGALSASDVDNYSFVATAGSTDVELTASGDAVFTMGVSTPSGCVPMVANQRQLRVTVAGGTKQICVKVSSPSRATQTYTLKKKKA